MGNLNFNANDVEPSQGFAPIPAGPYVVVIASSEVKTTKAGTGTYLKLMLEVIEGGHKGRKLFEQITLSNPNEQATMIGRGTLSALCRAIGCMAPSDSSELHGRPFLVTVGLKKRNDTGDMENVINEHKPAGNVAGVVVNGSSVPGRQTVPPTTAAPPWAKK